jgi:hypothetical protein
MRAAILALGLVLASVPTARAMPVTALPALPQAINVHGCHPNYARGPSGWHRHDKECRSLRGLVGRKGRQQARS